MGLVPGNRVLLRGTNNPMMAACLLAVIKAGLVAVPTMPLLRAKDLAPVVEKARVSAALCDVQLRDELDALRAHTDIIEQALFFNDGSGADDALETWLGDTSATSAALGAREASDAPATPGATVASAPFDAC